MYGNEMSEKVKRVSSSRPITLLRRAMFNPEVRRRQPTSCGAALSPIGILVRISANTTKRYVIALMMKISAIEAPSDRNTTTKIGPTTREPLIIAEFNDTAPGKSINVTSVGNIADHAGELRALPAPTPKATTKIDQVGASPATNGASSAEKESCTSCIAISHLRRSKRSAITPAGIERNSSGPSCAKATRPTSAVLPVRSRMYTGSTTFCIHVPMLDVNDAAHILRNLG